MDHLSQNIRLLIATTLSVLIILVWDTFFIKPMVEYQVATNNPVSESIQNIESKKIELVSKKESITNQNQRVEIKNSKVSGSINLIGARIDDLILTNYRTSLPENSPKIDLLSPSNTKDSYFAELGWIKTSGADVELPNSKTIWESDSKELNPEKPVKLKWQNPQGVVFTIKVTIDANYMFDIDQSVTNNSGLTFDLSPYSLITRVQSATEPKNVLIHEGAIGVFNNKLEEVEFEKLYDDKKIEYSGTTDWLGFSDKYWLTALIPDKSKQVSSKFINFASNGMQHYQVSFATMPEKLGPNSTITNKVHFFGGAKEIDLLDEYESKLNIQLFDRAVDFGMLYLITKPILILLHYFNYFFGNFGISILVLTVFVKLLLFPLANKGFKGMNRLKELQPKMMELKEKYKDDAMKFQKALLELYKKEKVNPMGGCLPIILQIPVFFALYKVLYVSIEMRHAPFFGWIKDLSVPDPTSVFNLFGLIPWDPPQMLMVGIFPLLMALTMYLQQRMNPEPTDPVQAKVMRYMPLIFLFMFASFPAGLVIYWAWSNMLSIAQQMMIKKMSGIPVIAKKTKK